MSTLRRGSRPVDNYTSIANGFARDKRLSLKARGLALYLLSHKEGWRITTSSLAKECGCGERQVRTALIELETYGYLT